MTALLATADAGESGDSHGVRFTVTVDTVREGRIDDIVVATGTVVAWREMPINTEANGLAIVDIRADDGDKSRKGQILARLNQAFCLPSWIGTEPLSSRRRRASPTRSPRRNGPTPLPAAS